MGTDLATQRSDKKYSLELDRSPLWLCPQMSHFPCLGLDSHICKAGPRLCLKVVLKIRSGLRRTPATSAGTEAPNKKQPPSVPSSPAPAGRRSLPFSFQGTCVEAELHLVGTRARPSPGSAPNGEWKWVEGSHPCKHPTSHLPWRASRGAPSFDPMAASLVQALVLEGFPASSLAPLQSVPHIATSLRTSPSP